MATEPDAVRGQLAVITAAAAAELSGATPDDVPDLLPLIIPAYYDAAGTLAVAWYDELRIESAPETDYAPRIIGDPATDWIEREVEAFRDADPGQFMAEFAALVEKEVARGYRDSILGNVRMDDEAVGWARIARPGACKFCKMLADKGAIFVEETALFAAHKNCHCAAQPKFRNGELGPEASVMQYVASSKRRTPRDRARLREYLNEHYPDAPG